MIFTLHGCPAQTQLAHKAHLCLGGSRLECCVPSARGVVMHGVIVLTGMSSYSSLFAALSENSLFF